MSSLVTPTATALRIGRQALRGNPLRAILSTLGVVIGVAWLVEPAAGAPLLGAGIGIMNAPLASVSGRTREIGIRKTTGARNGDILRQFLAESVVVSGAGSVVGVALGVALGVAGAFGLTALIRALSDAPLYAAITLRTLLIAAAASIAVGLVFGTYPARRAARLSPIDALRHE